MSRFRELRKTESLRQSIRETDLSQAHFIQPFFVVPGKSQKKEIASMPGIFRYSADTLLKAVEIYIKTGGTSAIFFGVPEKKSPQALEAYSPKGAVQQAVKKIKKEFPHFQVITDVCLCSYTDHGHCGIIKDSDIDNDLTLPVLSKTALSHAEAGADMVAPSDMMDFRVEHIRRTLNEHDYIHVPIMSYAVKYASSFYGPFRDAADSTPQFGDRKTYQMDYCNQKEALQEALQDVKEGADIIMVKPALAYLDVVSLLKNNISLPVAAYSVSGEYSMIKAAARNKWIDEKNIVLESLTCIKRAGADIILTYYAQDVIGWLKKDKKGESRAFQKIF